MSFTGKRLCHRYLPQNFAKFDRAVTLQNNYEGLLRPFENYLFKVSRGKIRTMYKSTAAGKNPDKKYASRTSLILTAEGRGYFRILFWSGGSFCFTKGSFCADFTGLCHISVNMTSVYFIGMELSRYFLAMFHSMLR